MCTFTAQRIVHVWNRGSIRNRVSFYKSNEAMREMPKGMKTVSIREMEIPDDECEEFDRIAELEIGCSLQERVFAAGMKM